MPSCRIYPGALGLCCEKTQPARGALRLAAVGVPLSGLLEKGETLDEWKKTRGGQSGGGEDWEGEQQVVPGMRAKMERKQRDQDATWNTLPKGTSATARQTVKCRLKHFLDRTSYSWGPCVISDIPHCLFHVDTLAWVKQSLYSLRQCMADRWLWWHTHQHQGLARVILVIIQLQLMELHMNTFFRRLTVFQNSKTFPQFPWPYQPCFRIFIKKKF